MRIVLDTNVLVSALLTRSGPPGRILAAVEAGSLTLVTSEPLLEELRDVLEYPKIRTRLDARGVDVGRFLGLLRFFVTVVPTDAANAPSVRDPDDRELLAARSAGDADWLITGDQDLLVLNAGQPVLSPSDFVARFLD